MNLLVKECPCNELREHVKNTQTFCIRNVSKGRHMCKLILLIYMGRINVGVAGEKGEDEVKKSRGNRGSRKKWRIEKKKGLGGG